MVALLAVAVVGLTAIQVLASFAPQASAPPSAATPGLDPSQHVAGAISIEETFDGLPMDSTLPAPWRVKGEGPVAIVALPTSVDRSIRISSDGRGNPSEACRPIESAAGRPLRLALDYRLGRNPPRDVVLLQLRQAAQPILNLVLGTDGRLVGLPGRPQAPGGPTSSPEAGVPAGDATTWRRVEVTVVVTVDGSGIAAWQAHEATGGDAGAGTVALGPDFALDMMCLLSPAESPAGWVAVDDLLIER